jgi:hypothetical protein
LEYIYQAIAFVLTTALIISFIISAGLISRKLKILSTNMDLLGRAKCLARE